ncbi:MAG: hypothetical protein ACJAVI_004803 [Candidatus Azotimanducaceae bacterium]|jgi:hypothetical protein
MSNTKLLIFIYFILIVPAFAEEQTTPATEPATRTLMWPDGTRYVGGVVNGKRTGKGTIFWQDGTRFVGNFKNDQRSGPGTMILPDGAVYNGIFEDDELVNTTTNADAPPSIAPSGRAPELSEPVASITAASLEAQDKMKSSSEQENGSMKVSDLAANEAQRPPQTAPLYQPVTRLNQETRLELESIIENWAAAWSKQDADRYLAHYSSQFEVPGNRSRSQWEVLRRSRLARPDFIKVSAVLEKVEVTGADKAEIIFKQTYTSDRYEDVARKRVILVKESETWLITKEQSI